MQSSCKASFIVVQFKKNWNVLRDFSKTPENQISRKSVQRFPSPYIWTNMAKLTGESLQLFTCQK
jgi:hypothetical protein